MAKKKQDEETQETQETSEEVVEEATEATEEISEKVFPYKFKLSSTGEMLTVVAEGVDAKWRKTLTTDIGCTYTA